MPDKDFTLEEFLQAEDDIIKKHRMPIDRASTFRELATEVKAPGGDGNRNGGGEVPPGFHRMPETGELMSNEEMQ